MPAVRRAALAASAMIVLAAAPSASHAAGTYEQRRACRADAMKFCRDYVPNVQRITACMERNIRRLSPQCRAQFR
jgi:type II secretory pathway component PulL